MRAMGDPALAATLTPEQEALEELLERIRRISWLISTRRVSPLFLLSTWARVSLPVTAIVASRMCITHLPVVGVICRVER